MLWFFVALLALAARAETPPVEFPSSDKLRYFRGDLSGIRIPELKNVPGCTTDVFFTAVYPCFPPEARAKMREAYRSRGYTHWPIMMPDGGGYHGMYPTCGDWYADAQGPKKFRGILQELWDEGFYPVVFMIPDMPVNSEAPDKALPKIQARLKNYVADKETMALIRLAAVAWEPLNGWMTPKTFTASAKWLKSVLPPQAMLYAHFTSGHAAGSDETESESGWWQAMKGTLQGLLYQHDGTEGAKAFQDRLWDFTVRFGAGYHGWPTGLDVVAFEYSAYWQTNKGESEAWGNALGKAAIETTTQPFVEGGATYVPAKVMGFADGGPFGPPTPPLNPCGVPAGANGAKVAAVQAPSTMKPGAKAQATITVVNTGASTWSARTGYQLGADAPHDNPNFHFGRVPLHPRQCVKPNERVTFSFTLTAPAKPGKYPLQWRMVRDKVEWFGRPSNALTITVK